MEVETLAGLGKDIGLTGALFYLWTRLSAVTDAYLASIKETTKGLVESTNATNNIARSMDELTRAIKKEG